jgi:hypothetical protein
VDFRGWQSHVAVYVFSPSCFSHRFIHPQCLVINRKKDAVTGGCRKLRNDGLHNLYSKLTPWPESASEIYRPSDLRLSAKLVPTFDDTRVSRSQRGGSPTAVISIF